MSQDDHSPDLDREERAAEERAALVAWKALEGEPPAAAEADEGEIRAYTELLGLLPYALEPAQAGPALRRRVLAAAGAEEAPRAEVAAVTPFRHQVSGRERPVGGERRWGWALAAGLAFCLVGLNVALLLQTRSQSAMIAALTGKLEAAYEQALASERRAARLAHTQQDLDMLTTIAAQLYPLRPAGGSPGANARGVMYVCANHQQWYLHLQGLKPAPEGFRYQLLFLTDSGPVEMETFQVHAGRAFERRGPSMPSATRGVVVALAPAGGAAPRSRTAPPADEVVLRGDRPIRL